uniref:Ovule protein n=1 Tax=Ascaris lumbricoides TaxID=6252 RepID=A0A0M3IUF4_ASCLU
LFYKRLFGYCHNFRSNNSTCACVYLPLRGLQSADHSPIWPNQRAVWKQANIQIEHLLAIISLNVLSLLFFC